MAGVDVLVVGGSQAGLAAGYHLQRQGADFRIVDAAPAPGHAWRSRWDSPVLFTSRRFSALPGMPVPGDPDSYAARTPSPTTWTRTPSGFTCRSSSRLRSSRWNATAAGSWPT